MHQSNLPDWYRTAGMQPDPDKIPKRITAINTFEPSPEQIVSLVRLFFGIGELSAEFFSTLRAVFREHDSIFSNQGNEAELSVLAGAKLVQLMHAKPSKNSQMATLAVVCAACQGLRKNPPVPQIPEVALKRLAAQSKERAQVLVERLTPLQQEPKNADGFEVGKEFAKMQSDIRIVMEESNMLWWLFAEHSRDENRRWEELEFPGCLLKIGKELADLTEILPGPPAAAAFLDRVCRVARSKLPEKVDLSSAINGLDTEWKKNYCEGSDVQALEHVSPVTNALRLSLLTSGDGNWAPVFSGSTQIDPKSALAPQKLCFQIYLENLLTRAWRQTNELNER